MTIVWLWNMPPFNIAPVNSAQHFVELSKLQQLISIFATSPYNGADGSSTRRRHKMFSSRRSLTNITSSPSSIARFLLWKAMKKTAELIRLAERRSKCLIMLIVDHLYSCTRLSFSILQQHALVADCLPDFQTAYFFVLFVIPHYSS